MEEKNTAAKTTEKKPIMNSFDDKKTSFFNPILLIAIVVVVIVGIGTGQLLARSSGLVNTPAATTSGNSKDVPKGTIVGSSDTSTFKDSTEGVLEEGGIDGEGEFHLVRPGGESQNVYLTSSIVDLSAFLKRKIKIWGETHKAQKAGWLMDVGRVQVLE